MHGIALLVDLVLVVCSLDFRIMRFVILAWAFILFNFVECDPFRHIHNRNDVIYTVQATRENQTVCSVDDAKEWSYEFHNCFIDRKYNDGGRDLNNIVDRVLDHSKDCVKNSTHQCRPNHEGFMVIMDKVIQQIKEYCAMYVEHIIHDREKIKDLNCVEKILSKNTYESCFKEVLDKDGASQPKFQKDVERAIRCTNRANRKCSKAAKTDLNNIARHVLGLKQPAKEEIEDDPKPPEPPKPWYYWIVQPFVSFWNSFRSFFGF